MEISDVLKQKIDGAVKASQPVEKSTMLWTSLQVAQWALESGWGAHQPGNNCFGIKYEPRHIGSQLLWTVEYVKASTIDVWRAHHPELQVLQLVGDELKIRIQLPFAIYNTLEDCFADHAALLTTGKNYRVLFEAAKPNPTPDLFIIGMAHFYATAPNYAQVVQSIITEYCLGTYDRWWEPQ